MKHTHYAIRTERHTHTNVDATHDARRLLPDCTLALSLTVRGRPRRRKNAAQSNTTKQVQHMHPLACHQNTPVVRAVFTDCRPVRAATRRRTDRCGADTFPAMHRRITDGDVRM